MVDEVNGDMQGLACQSAAPTNGICTGSPKRCDSSTGGLRGEGKAANSKAVLGRVG